MISDPYVQEEYRKGVNSAIFHNLNHELNVAAVSEKEPKIGDMIGQ